jgi:hypothetical protein
MKGKSIYQVGVVSFKAAHIISIQPGVASFLTRSAFRLLRVPLGGVAIAFSLASTMELDERIRSL